MFGNSSSSSLSGLFGNKSSNNTSSNIFGNSTSSGGLFGISTRQIIIHPLVVYLELQIIQALQVVFSGVLIPRQLMAIITTTKLDQTYLDNLKTTVRTQPRISAAIS